MEICQDLLALASAKNKRCNVEPKLQPIDLAVFQQRQISILVNALAHLKPGGILVYSTCSLEAEENEEVIRTFSLDWRTWRRIPGLEPGDGFFAAVLKSE